MFGKNRFYFPVTLNFTTFASSYSTTLQNFNIMANKIKSAIAVLTMAALTACIAGNKPAKPLIAGIRDGNRPEAVSQQSENTSQRSETVSRQSKALEIPAPIKGSNEIILKRTGYTVSYNPTTKLPNWVAWHLTSERCMGKAKRQQKEFHEDDDVPTPRATDLDYYNSRFDRGHMCPAGDNKWSENAMYESFLFTNICPQNPNLNRGDWNEMENQCRKWAREYGNIYIVCGPILYKTKHKTIGKDKVVVPEAFFKVVLCMKGKPKAIGFIYKNEAGNRPKGNYVNTVDEVERITGIDFFPALPDNIENKIEAKANAGEWGI